MHWAAPEYAWLLLLGIPAAFLLRRAQARRRDGMIRLAGENPALPTRSRGARQLPAYALPAFAFLLFIAALCRPQWGHETLQQQSRGLDILVALDVSRSMLADDLSPNRLAAAKQAIRGLLPRLRGDRIGLIAFAGSAFQVCPLTSDYGAFAAVLAETGSDTIPLGGTSLAAPLLEARRAFTGYPGRGKILILISDGEDHGGAGHGGDLAAEALRGAGVTLYSVAAGSVAGGLIPLPGGEFLKNSQGAIVRSRMQPEPLRTLANAGGGRQYDLASDPGVLDSLFATELYARERRLIQGTRQQLADRYQYPLALALVLLLVPLLSGPGKP
jgi:Ca-activated chloride channel family protein